jgi:hypothetical protein
MEVRHAAVPADRPVAQHVVDQYDLIREAEEGVQEAKERRVRARYEWGTEVNNALARAEHGDGVAKRVSRQIDHSVQYVYNHARFARRVDKHHGGIEGYIEDCQRQDRALTWSAARDWTDAKGDSSSSTGAEEVDEQKKRVERSIETLEEEATELWETAKAHDEELEEAEMEEVKGVVVTAKQKIDDTDPNEVPTPDPSEHRHEWEAYRRWVETKGCVACGAMDDTVVGHHLDRGGHGTKGPDTLLVGLCDTCHTTLHNMDEEAFWQRQPVNPWKIAAEYQAEVLSALDEIASLIKMMEP